MQGGYDDGAAHLVAFATTNDIFVILWRYVAAASLFLLSSAGILLETSKIGYDEHVVDQLAA